MTSEQPAAPGQTGGATGGAPAAKDQAAPARRDEGQPLANLRQEMDRLFDDFFASTPFSLLRRRQLDADPWRRLQSVFDATAPVVDITASEQGYRVTAELPGMTGDDLDIGIANGVLTIKGHKAQESRAQKDEYLVAERRYGSFQRSFPLPEDADPDRIEADLKNGLLVISLPRRADAAQGRRKIEVKGS